MAYPIFDHKSNNGVPSSIRNSHQFIAIHFLGVDGGENWNLYGGGYGGHTTIFLNGDIHERCFATATIWAVGASSGWKQKHPVARNMNTFSIELCCYNDHHVSASSDPTWYFTQATQEAAVQYVRKKFADFGWKLDKATIDERLLRHYDITTKPCPNPYVISEGYVGTKGTNWTWAQFKEAVRTGTCPNPYVPPIPKEKIYRIRKSWKDAASQFNAYYNLEIAKANCPVGFTVYDWDGVAVFRNTGRTLPYMVRVLIPDLNIRKGAGTNFAKTGKQTGKGVFTIIEESVGTGAALWGRLKSGAGWIALEDDWVEIL